jgi:putative FmdB family regulatory protein
MPLYEFRCNTCGEFDAWRTLAEATDPMPCPECSTIAKRIFSAPNVSLNSGSLSRDSKEPRLVKKADRQPTSPKHSSPQGGRPWMISH